LACSLLRCLCCVRVKLISLFFSLFFFVLVSLQFWGVVEDQLCRLQRFGAPTAQSPVTALYMRPYAVLPSKPTHTHTTRSDLTWVLRTQRRQGAVQR
jgi:hypothetical protein